MLDTSVICKKSVKRTGTGRKPCTDKKNKMKNKKRIEKKYVDELKDEYDRLGEIRDNRLTVGCLVTILLVLSLIALKLGLIIIK